MNIKMLKKGQVYKNYKELCKALGEEFKTSDSKQAQINHWSNYFEYHNEGHKWIIDKVYKKPKGRHSIYGFVSDIEELILDLIVQDKNNGSLFLPKVKFFRLLSLVNSNYNLGRYNIPKLSHLTEINQLEIKEFFELSTPSIENSVNTALNNLAKKKLIVWSKSITICQLKINLPKNYSDYVIDIETRYDEFGNSIYDYEIANKITEIHRKADTEEIKKILGIERESLTNFSCENEQQIIQKGKWKEYKEQINKRLNEEMNVLYTYDSYEIIFNYNHIADAWTDIKQYELEEYARNLKQININNSISNNLISNAENRIKRTLELKEKKEKFKDHRLEKEYLDNVKDLIKLLIECPQPSIKLELYNIKLN